VRAVGVAAGLGGELHGIPVQAHQLSERFTAAVLDGAAGGLDEVNDVRGHPAVKRDDSEQTQPRTSSCAQKLSKTLRGAMAGARALRDPDLGAHRG